MKKSIIFAVPMFVFVAGIYLSSCSPPSQFPTDAKRALKDYWQSLPSDPTPTYQILEAWQGDVPAETSTTLAPNMEVWCVETKITAATDASIIGETVTWIVIKNDDKADWNVAMLATMSSIWPYEACGKGP